MSQKKDALADERISPITNGVVVTLSDTVDTMLECPAAIDVERDNKYCRGFHCNATGSLKVYYPELEVSINIEVVSGSYYPYQIKRFLVTGTAVGLLNNIIAMR